ncbi:MAG: homocysteine S-methyltransferase family protein [SAR324 cluster bacterium]|nr:homocysteine S-methyltransferase family protein [SAR324 cluster bacterium]
MDNILLGDTDPAVIYQEMSKKEMAYQEFIADQAWLFNIYSHNIRDGSQLVRTPTLRATRSFLDKWGIDEPLETYYNVAVSQAKAAIKASMVDILLAGVIGPTLGTYKRGGKLNVEEISEAVILLDDFSVDFLFLQGFSNLATLNAAIATCVKLSKLPIAAFFPVSALDDKKQVQQLNKLIASFGVELCGISGDDQGLHILKEKMKSKTEWGLMIGEVPHQNMDKFCDNIISQQPSLIMAGTKLSRKDWKFFLKEFSLAQLKNQRITAI